MSTGFCEANGISIHYHCRMIGAGKPPVILLHGLSADGACWGPVAEALAPDHDVIMPDARGHGRSSVPERGYRYEDLANDVVGLLAALDVPSPVLIGHSMGGLTAAVVAARIPRRLRGLILADPTFLSPNVQHEVHCSDVVDQHRSALQKTLDELVAEIRMKHPTRPLDTVETLARARLHTSLAAFDVLTPPSPDFRQLVSEIAVPSLLVIAERGVVSPTLAEEVRRMNPRFQVRQIPDAGHGLHYDQPERFAAVVTAFLRSLAI